MHACHARDATVLTRAHRLAGTFARFTNLLASGGGYAPDIGGYIIGLYIGLGPAMGMGIGIGIGIGLGPGRILRTGLQVCTRSAQHAVKRRYRHRAALALHVAHIALLSLCSA